nr:rho gtpase activating protein 8 [Hymenolepis microstoma]
MTSLKRNSNRRNRPCQSEPRLLQILQWSAGGMLQDKKIQIQKILDTYGAIRTETQLGKESKTYLTYSDESSTTYFYLNGTRTTPDLLLVSSDISELTQCKIIDDPESGHKPVIASSTTNSKSMTPKMSTKELCIQEVIDAEFRDITRLGVIQVGGTDHDGRRVIAFFACRLPDSDMIDHDRLLEYVNKTLEQYVASDYTLVYFHWGLTNRNKPNFSWLVRAYQTLDRSTKMKRKLNYVKNLRELETYLPVSQLNLPLRIREYDSKIGLLGIPISIDPAAASVLGDHDLDTPPFYEKQQFGVTLEFIRENDGGRTIPIVVEDTITYLRREGLDTVGIFIKPIHIMALHNAQNLYNCGECVDLYEMNSPHLAAHLLKSFLTELREPLLTFDLYEDILRASSQTAKNKVISIRRLLTFRLPKENYDILHYIFKFLTEYKDEEKTELRKEFAGIRDLLARLPAEFTSTNSRVRPIHIVYSLSSSYDSKIGLLGIPISIDPAAASVLGDHDLDTPPFYEKQQFGVTLEFIRENDGGRTIPIVVEDTITYLRREGLDTVGIFIKPIHIMALHNAQNLYNCGECVDLYEMNSPHLAAHLLKSFLTELREPLLTFDLYEDILRASSQTAKNKVISIRRLLTFRLPKENYDILHYIFKFLTEVLEHSSKNSVTAASLSVTLAPALIRCRQNSVMPSQSVRNLIISFTQLCITHFESVFTRSAAAPNSPASILTLPISHGFASL